MYQEAKNCKDKVGEEEKNEEGVKEGHIYTVTARASNKIAPD